MHAESPTPRPGVPRPRSRPKRRETPPIVRVVPEAKDRVPKDKHPVPDWILSLEPEYVEHVRDAYVRAEQIRGELTDEMFRILKDEAGDSDGVDTAMTRVFDSDKPGAWRKRGDEGWARKAEEAMRLVDLVERYKPGDVSKFAGKTDGTGASETLKVNENDPEVGIIGSDAYQTLARGVARPTARWIEYPGIDGGDPVKIMSREPDGEQVGHLITALDRQLRDFSKEQLVPIMIGPVPEGRVDKINVLRGLRDLCNGWIKEVGAVGDLVNKYAEGTEREDAFNAGPNTTIIEIRANFGAIKSNYGVEVNLIQ